MNEPGMRVRGVPHNKGMNLSIRRGFKGTYHSLTVFIYSRLAGYPRR